LRVVENSKAEKEIFAIEFSDVPVTTADEKMQINNFILAVDFLGLIKPRDFD